MRGSSNLMPSVLERAASVKSEREQSWLPNTRPQSTLLSPCDLLCSDFGDFAEGLIVLGGTIAS